MPVKYICDICCEEIDTANEGNFGDYNLVLKTKNGLHVSIEAHSLRKNMGQESNPNAYEKIREPVLCYKCVMSEVLSCVDIAPYMTAIVHPEYPEDDVPF